MSYMEIRNLKKVYNPYCVHPKVALNGLDFEVEKEILFVLWEHQALENNTC